MEHSPLFFNSVKLGPKVSMRLSAQMRQVIHNGYGFVLRIINIGLLKSSLISIHYRTLRKVISVAVVISYAFFCVDALASNEPSAQTGISYTQDSARLSTGYASVYALNVKLNKVTFRIAKQNWDFLRLAEAIRCAEGIHSKHPYGILKHYKHTTPKQACINTINSAYKRFLTQSTTDDFITFLSRSYAPLGAKNDPLNLNSNWVNNVRYFYERV